MELISSNSSDIQKYYEGSYVKLREFGDKLFLINKVTRECVYFTDSTGDEGVIYLHDSCPYTLNMVLPNKAMYQVDQHCYLLQRIPARQYHRGITSNNCAIKLLNSGGWGSVALSFTTLTGYVEKPVYRPLEQIIETCTSGSEAITARFAYQAAGKKIWCDTKLIATVNTKLKTITGSKLLIPELERFLLRGELNTTYKLIGI